MFTKPCARPGCTGVVEEPTPAVFEERQFCSVRCVVKVRIAAGWKPHGNLTPEIWSRGGSRGGKIAGLHRRKATTIKHATRIAAIIPQDLEDALSPKQLALVKVLLVRAVRIGHRKGYRAGYAAKRYRPRVPKTKAA